MGGSLWDVGYEDASPPWRGEGHKGASHVGVSLRALPLPAQRIMNFIGEEYRRVFRHDEWNIGIVHEPIHVFLESDIRPEVHWLPPQRRGRYLADPFAIAREGMLYILCEEFDYHSNKGVISCIELANETRLSPPRVAMNLPFHASYPFLFKHKEAIYCIPETSQAREIGLYKAQEFPHRWTKVATLRDNIAGLDGTVFQHEGRWWLTFTDSEDGPEYKLHVWHAPDLFGPWNPHANNPVKVDISSCRPAGTPFVHNGNLYRPAQDSSRTYGGRIIINRMLRLTPTEYEEETAAVIEPFADSPYAEGIHTISAAGNFTLVDGKRSIFIKGALRQSLKDAITRRWKDALLTRWLPKIRTS